MNTKVIIQGSGAAEGIPALWCNCDICRNAHEVGGKEIRRRASYNVNGVLNVDFGPDAMQAFQNAYPLINKLQHIIITHAHEDHFAPMEFLYHSEFYAKIPTPLHIYTDKRGLEIFTSIANLYESIPEGLEKGYNITLHEVKKFTPFKIDDIGATVYPLEADHATNRIFDSFIYIVTIDGKNILFGNDTGYFPESTWEYLSNLKLELDLVILDNTGCLLDWRRAHMGSQAVLDCFERLGKMGFITSKTKKFVNHFSHNGGSSHAQLCKFYNPLNIEVGYDDEVIEL